MIVSNRLPLSVTKTDGKLTYHPSVGGLATGLSAYTRQRGTVWIGWPGIASDNLSDHDKQEITTELKKHRCKPVFLTQRQLDDYYSGYGNGVLWPLFHDLPTHPHNKRVWQAYQRVNKLFAEAALAVSTPDTTVWVHDYQLLLVPSLLRRGSQLQNIGFFLHIPFPAEAALRDLPETNELLRGMLGANLIGFHTRSYSQNFLHACDMELSSGRQQDFVLFNGRTVRVAEFPMGIDYARFLAATKLPNNRPELRKLRERYRPRTIILTVDRLDPSKGLEERLSAYRQLLREHPELHKKIVLVMIVAPSRTDIKEYAELKKRLDRLLREIASQFGERNWQPVDFIYRAVPLDSVMQYYQIADIAFITPLRDGMNLVAKEYLASNPNGVLILSTTAGAAEELHDAIQVDPTDPDSLVEGLYRALYLPKRELRARANRMRWRLKRFTVQTWANSFITTLQRPAQAARTPIHNLTTRRSRYLRADYHRASRRLLLLDYDGTLREFVTDPKLASPSPQLTKLLRRLGSNPANEVVMISGRSRQDLLEWFGNLPLALAAEHGAFFRRAGGKNWHHTTSVDPAWQAEVKDVFTDYLALTPGAIIEQKDAALVWHYRAASPFHAQKNLVAMRRQLKPVLKRYGLSEKQGHKMIEVHPSDVSKGRAAQEWVLHDFDFVLAIGDDATDEDMFNALPPGGYSIKVGFGSSAARYRLTGVPDVLRLLDSL